MSESDQNGDGMADLPYAQRQFVQFETAATTLPEEKKDEYEVKVFSILPGLILPLWLAEKALQKYEEALDVGIEIIPVPIEQATRFSLPPGHPQQDVLYVAHPSDPMTYLPTADFHRLVFEHKFAEATRLLMHLGAKTINVTHTRGWDHEFAGTLSAGIPQADVTSSADASAESEQSMRLLYEAELTGHNEPAVPDDTVWFPHEPTWQSTAEARIKFGPKRFSLKLQYTDDYGVNANLAIGAQNAGFSLGGSFEKHQKTVWSLEGKFGG